MQPFHVIWLSTICVGAMNEVKSVFLIVLSAMAMMIAGCSSQTPQVLNQPISGAKKTSTGEDIAKESPQEALIPAREDVLNLPVEPVFENPGRFLRPMFFQTQVGPYSVAAEEMITALLIPIKQNQEFVAAVYQIPILIMTAMASLLVLTATIIMLTTEQF